MDRVLLSKREHETARKVVIYRPLWSDKLGEMYRATSTRYVVGLEMYKSYTVDDRLPHEAIEIAHRHAEQAIYHAVYKDIHPLLDQMTETILGGDGEECLKILERLRHVTRNPELFRD